MRITSRGLRYGAVFLFLMAGFPSVVRSVHAGEPQIYWALFAGPDDSKIQRANLDGTGVQDLVTTGLDAPWDLEIDGRTALMYWGDVNTNRIERAQLDGTTRETVVEGPPFSFIDGPGGLAIDSEGNAVYWTDFVLDRINRTDLTTGITETVLSTDPGHQGNSNPFGISLDPRNEVMYWVDSSQGTIQRADQDGANVEVLITGLNNPRDVELDIAAGKMYWVDILEGVFRADLDGGNPERLIDSAFPPGFNYLTLDLPHGKIYWSHGHGVTAVSRANLDGTDVEWGVVSGLDGSVMGVAVVPEPSAAICLLLGVLAGVRNGHGTKSCRSAPQDATE